MCSQMREFEISEAAFHKYISENGFLEFEINYNTENVKTAEFGMNVMRHGTGIRGFAKQFNSVTE